MEHKRNHVFLALTTVRRATCSMVAKVSYGLVTWLVLITERHYFQRLTLEGFEIAFQETHVKKKEDASYGKM